MEEVRAYFSAAIIDRSDVGRKVELIEVQNDWSRVRDNLPLEEGWIASRFLEDREPEKKPVEPPKQKPTSIPPALAPSVIIQRIITESVANCLRSHVPVHTARIVVADDVAIGAHIQNPEAMRRSASHRMLRNR